MIGIRIICLDPYLADAYPDQKKSRYPDPLKRQDSGSLSYLSYLQIQHSCQLRYLAILTVSNSIKGKKSHILPNILTGFATIEAT